MITIFKITFSLSFSGGYPTTEEYMQDSRKSKTDDQMTSEEIRERELRFQNFLGRQQQSALRKDQHLKSVTFTFQEECSTFY